MQIGAIFPQTEIGADPVQVREFAQAVEDLGYAYIFIADHVLGADDAHHRHDYYEIYNHRSLIHESLTVLGYLAAVTKTVGLVTGILILPQRQTVLVAKQAAEVDVLSGGRLRLGIGVGWNPVEFEALGQNFKDRGRRSEEQIALLRALWTQEVVDFRGRWHRVDHAGLNPLPVQRPIPIWIGAGNSGSPIPPDAVLRRIARLADGWSPSFPPDEKGRRAVASVQGYATAAGRDPATLGLEGRLGVGSKQPEEWRAEVKAWEDLGATHLCIETRRFGLRSLDEHIDTFRRFKEAIAW